MSEQRGPKLDRSKLCTDRIKPVVYCNPLLPDDYRIREFRLHRLALMERIEREQRQ